MTPPTRTEERLGAVSARPCELGKGTLKVLSQNPDLGEAKEEVPVEYAAGGRAAGRASTIGRDRDLLALVRRVEQVIGPVPGPAGFQQ